MLTINPFTVVTLLDIRKEKKKLGLQGDRRRRRGGGAVILLLSSFLLEMDNFSVCNIYR